MEEKPPNLTKHGGFYIIVMGCLMKGDIPVMTDGSPYPDEDDDDSQEVDHGEVEVADPEAIQNFINLCRCSDEDIKRHNYLAMKDMRLPYEERHYIKDFFTTVKLHPEPIKCVKICEALQAGRIVLATELTKYFLITYIGNDFTNPLKDKIRKCRNNGSCTFTVTKTAFAAQRASRCRTCFPDDPTMTICDNCVASCHKGHDTYINVKRVNIKNKRNNKKNKTKITAPKTLMYCDCGHKLNCKLL